MASSAPVIEDIALCLGFFTRIPVAGRSASRAFAEALWAAPVAGAVVGLLVGLVLVLSSVLDLPPAVGAGLALAAGFLATGGLHEDGLGDVADGFGGGRDRAAKLAIMRDSRMGTYGVAALVFSFLLRWSALTSLAALDAVWTAGLCIAAHAASRALLPAFLVLVPPARSDGLGAGVGPVSLSTALVALGLGAASLLPFGIADALVSAALLAVLFFGMARLCRRQIGGQTGDVLGALQQAAEIAVLLVFCVGWRPVP